MAAASSSGDADLSEASLFEMLFALYDRDGSGYAQESDVIAALTCATHSVEMSRKMLGRVEESGRPDLHKFRTLLEACVELSLPKGAQEPSPQLRQKMLVKLTLAVVRNFERQATKAEQFREAASARECMAQIRAAEEARQYDALSVRQTHERKGVQEKQAQEVAQFSGAWKASLAEYEASAEAVVQQLRERHDAAYGELLGIERAAAQQRVHRHSKEALEAMRVQERLVRQGDFHGVRREVVVTCRVCNVSRVCRVFHGVRGRPDARPSRKLLSRLHGRRRRRPSCP